MLVALLFSIDATIYAIAIVLAAVLPVWVTTRSARHAAKETQKAVDVLHAEVKTNHGKKASEYLEMIADVKTEMTMMNGRLDSLGKTMGAQDQRFVDLLAQHTSEDEARFDQIISRLDRVNA